jgi:acetyl/propionyl-CoA carboxylase alpha subunit
MLDQHQQAMAFHQSGSDWTRSFSLQAMKILIVCRGPVRKTAFEVFDQAGVGEYGMLLSENDSVAYQYCLAPELRSMRFPPNVHRVPEYMGTGQAQKQQRIREIIEIALSHGYTHVFCGYGFMAEDADFIGAIENAGLGVVGPSSRVARYAGAKDEAKKMARRLGNKVIPGVDDVTARALLKKAPDEKALQALARKHELAWTWDAARELGDNAELLLQAGYARAIDIVTIEELQDVAGAITADMWKEHPGRRIRLKAIGGGGGKGQRVVRTQDEVPGAVNAVLAEAKVLPAGSNRNFLVELEVERTRHNEIQLIGNGTWCVALGGRDCSVQMHEQKLLEVSLTRELLLVERDAATSPTTKSTLEQDIACLERMELEGERLGEACGLDSVSTFECVVSGFEHFFMEVNSRVQVEHGVTELAYRLRFTNPEDPNEYFEVERLIEAMALLALHGKRLPRPTRTPRWVSGAEVRINATDDALQPHAGGIVGSWTAPVADEIRHDQGIGTRNPDTQSFPYYNLAGAYDSNIALVLTHGANRADNLARMSDMLRRMQIRGRDVHTNLLVHYGLLNWFLGRGAMAKPTTRFMGHYLGAVGAMRALAADVDLDMAAAEIARGLDGPAARHVFQAKETLLLRPLRQLLADGHLLAGFLGRYEGTLWSRDGERVRFLANPIDVLDALHHYLDLDPAPGKPPCDQIWDHDLEILSRGQAFYGEVTRRTGARTYEQIEKLFGGKRVDLLATDDAAWQRAVAAHRGFQLGLDLLLVPARIGARVGFGDFRVHDDLEIEIPEAFADPTRAAALAKALAPPPKRHADEIVAPMGGTFYGREAPNLPPLINEGEHFAAGQPLFIIEVMKMFNKVLAPCAGRVVKNLLKTGDGSVVSKGQVVFMIEPDEVVEEEPIAEVEARRREVTRSLVSASA